MFFFSILFACTQSDKDSAQPDVFTFPEVSSMPALRGPGAPQVDFTDEQLFENCAPLYGGEEDFLHHNLVVGYRGHMMMPWAPEWGRGGISLFDMSDPCSPLKVGEGFHERMRESHAIGTQFLSETEQYAVTTGILGIQFWDLQNLETPEMIEYMQIEGVFYPDSYTRVVLSLFWQYPYVYVAAADNGFFVVDATDPYNPTLETQYQFDPPLRAASIYAMGNQLFVGAAEGSESEILDISDPTNPQPIGGGRYFVTDADGTPRDAYHSGMVGNWGIFARKESGGGIMMMDISDPSNPTFAGAYKTEGGNGGYAYYHQGYGFVGDSHWAAVLDMRDLSNIQEIGRGNLPGDLDTITPYGNVAILSVDDEPVDGIASVVMPWRKEADREAPNLLRTVPVDGETGVALTGRIGLGFDEFIEPTSVFAGSVRLYDASGNAIDGWGSGQETIANFTPKEPLLPNTTYTVEVLAEGIQDLSGNKLASTHTFSFTTTGN